MIDSNICMQYFSKSHKILEDIKSELNKFNMWSTFFFWNSYLHVCQLRRAR